MALVHSRIYRVFYGCPYSQGALGSKYLLHTQKGINHHFDVYKVPMKECQELYNAPPITWPARFEGYEGQGKSTLWLITSTSIPDSKDPWNNID